MNMANVSIINYADLPSIEHPFTSISKIPKDGEKAFEIMNQEQPSTAKSQRVDSSFLPPLVNVR